MSVHFVAFTAGIALIITAIFGGGFEVKEAKVPMLRPIPRALCGLFGAMLLYVYFFETEHLIEYPSQERTASSPKSGAPAQATDPSKTDPSSATSEPQAVAPTQLMNSPDQTKQQAPAPQAIAESKAALLKNAPASGSKCKTADPTSTPLNLRDNEGKIIGALTNGLIVSVIKIRQDNRGSPWALISTQDGKKGWVYREYLSCFAR